MKRDGKVEELDLTLADSAVSACGFYILHINISSLFGTYTVSYDYVLYLIP